MSDFAKDSGHWYKEDGTPAYEVNYVSKAGTRPTTLRDAKKMGLLPSVTGIMGVIAKPALERWKINQAVESALTSPHLEAYKAGELSERDFLELIDKDARESAKKAAERGSQIHGYIERWFKDGYTGPGECGDYIETACIAIDKVCGRAGLFREFDAEKSCANLDLRYAGKVDLHSKSLNIVIDYKTKDGDLSNVKAYDEQCAQLVAYAHALGMPDALLANIFFSRDDHNAYKVHVWSEEDKAKGWELFKAARELYRVIKGV